MSAATGDGVISETEQWAYAEHVLQDLSLTVDGNSLTPRLASMKFPEPAEMKEGLGEIQIEFTADLPAGGPNRTLVFQNYHQSQIAAYVNCLVRHDPNIRVLAQNRNTEQSFYRLNYVQTDRGAVPLFPESSAGVGAWIGTARSWVRPFAGMFHLGMRHIAEGTDNRPSSVLARPPFASAATGDRSALGRIRGRAPRSIGILRVVTAFTIGHSITLAVAAWGFVHVPSRPVEVLIAISILVSAAHALRPLFAGREAVIAAFFGLIHGLAFATTLAGLGLGRWERAANILGFNLGIETMQLIVVAAIMPSLILLSGRRAYTFLRIGGALFAGLASVGWIAERLLNVHSGVDVIVDGVAHRAVWIAGALLLISIFSWAVRNVFDKGIADEPLPRAGAEENSDGRCPA